MNESTRDPSDEQVRALLHCLLDTLRRVADTPLDARLDGDGMAAAILSRLHWRPETDWLHDACSRLDGILAGALASDGEAGGPPSDDAPVEAEAKHPVGRWLEQTHERLRAVHLWALEVAALRLEGLDDRTIAARLGLGRRLVGLVRREAAARLEARP